MKGQASDVLRWLRETGLLRQAEPWARQVSREIERRWWLSLFGEKWEDWEPTCSPWSPWSPGHSPEDVAARRKAAEVDHALRVLAEFGNADKLPKDMRESVQRARLLLEAEGIDDHTFPEAVHAARAATRART